MFLLFYYSLIHEYGITLYIVWHLRPFISSKKKHLGLSFKLNAIPVEALCYNSQLPDPTRL